MLDVDFFVEPMAKHTTPIYLDNWNPFSKAVEVLVVLVVLVVASHNCY